MNNTDKDSEMHTGTKKHKMPNKNDHTISFFTDLPSSTTVKQHLHFTWLVEDRQLSGQCVEYLKLIIISTTSNTNQLE